MATHSSILAWEVPWTEPGGLHSIGLVARVGHDLVTKTTKQPLRVAIHREAPVVSAGARTGQQTQAVPRGASLRPNIQKYKRSLAVLYFYTVNFLLFLQIRRLLKKKKDPNTKVFFFFLCIYSCVQKCQEGWKCKGGGGKTGNSVLSAPHPGTQLYHSLLCIVLQFLILRLMGRTITAVLTTFCVQMVNVSLPGQLSSQPAGLGAGEGQGLGWRRSRGPGDPQRPSAVRLWVSVQRPWERPLQASPLDPVVRALEPVGISAAICPRGESLKVKAGDPLGMSCRM